MLCTSNDIDVNLSVTDERPLAVAAVKLQLDCGGFLDDVELLVPVSF